MTNRERASTSPVARRRSRGTRVSLAGLVPVAAFAVAIALVAYRLAARVAAGPMWDSFVYLDNAAAFAGRVGGYTEYGRPPLLSLVAAVPLGLGWDHIAVIQVVDAAFALAGLVAFYMLARRRFGTTTSACMMLALLMTPPLWQWLGVGMTDFAAVGLWLWTLICTVRATEVDQRWFLAAIPLLLAAVLMKATSVLFVMPLCVWLVFRSRPFRQVRPLVIGTALAVAAYTPLAIYYARRTGDPFFMSADSLRINEAATAFAVTASATNVPLSSVSAFVEFDSYLRSLPVLVAPSTMAPATIAVLAIAAAGCFSAVSAVVRGRRVNRWAVVVAGMVAIAAVWAVTVGGSIGSQVAVSVGVGLVWYLLASRPVTGRAGKTRVVPAAWALDAVFAASTLASFAFFETWGMRTGRYYLPMAPGVIYFVAVGVRGLVRLALRTRRSVPELRVLRLAPVAALVAALAMLVPALALDVAGTDWTRDPLVDEAGATAAWIAHNDATGTALTYSDIYPYTGWFLDSPVRAMPTFDTIAAVSHELAKNGADNFVTRRDAPIAGYRTAWSSGRTRVLVRDEAATPASRPSVQLLGTGWENYLEELTGYSFSLMHDEGAADAQGSAFLDAYPADRLARFPVVAVFGVRWHDRSAAERIITDYVKGGGTLVIDASRNLDVPYSLADAALFDTAVTRQTLPPGAAVAVDPSFAARHPEIGHVDASPFVDEGGGVWSGARYVPLPKAASPRVLATVGGRPLALESSWGRGRIIWIAGNLAWHARLTGNPGEARLLCALFDEALTPATGG